MRKALFVSFLLAAGPLLASSAEGGGDSTLTLLLKGLNLLLFTALLVFLLAKPVKGFFEARDEAVSSELEQAREKEERAASIMEEIDRKIETYTREEKVIRERYEVEIERMEGDAKIALGKEIETIKASVESQIEQQVRIARADLKKETLELSIAYAEKQLEKSVNDEDRKLFIDRMIKGMNA